MKPRLTAAPIRARKGRILFVCYYDPNFIATVVENIGMWQRLSSYEILVYNMWPNRNALLTLPSTLELDDFDAMVIHSTASYFYENLASLDRALPRGFEEWDGIKVLMKQDEQVKPGYVARYLGEKKFDLLVTCVPEKEIRKVYPESVVGDLAFLHAYTGYISPAQRDLWTRYGNTERDITLSYRGSTQPLQFGRLGIEKRKIGYDVAKLDHPDCFTVDISSREEDRIGGTGWFDFLGRSKAVLGCESGSNLFDFEGDVEKWCHEYAVRTTDLDVASEDYYLRAHHEFLASFEGNVDYAQISPRHLEAACAGAVQIMYEGLYSGIFEAGRHFIPLKRDLTNWSEVVDALNDSRFYNDMRERAYEEIALNEDLQYSRFVETFDRAIDKALDRKRLGKVTGRTVFGKSSRPRVLITASHDPVQDPRIGWWASQLSKHVDVCELGTVHTSIVGDGPSFTRVSPSRLQVRIERSRHDWTWLSQLALGNEDPGISALLKLRAFEVTPRRHIAHALGAFSGDENHLQRFREYCTYFINTSSALMQAGHNLGPFDVVLCCDIDTLPCAVSLAKRWNAKLVYDAHEYWPYAFMNFEAWENQFWASFEASLAPLADRRLVVSPPLADIMSREYGVPFESVPNCAPLADGDAVDVVDRAALFQTKPQIDFLFQGGFSGGRGLQHLVQAWQYVTAPARLLLRGKDGEYKSYCIELAKNLGLYNRTVFFPEPVTEPELIAAAAASDVGLVPYEPLNVNNRHASPNKLSQYMAASLPILSNTLSFVGQIVNKSGGGRVVDFSDHRKLAWTVDEMTNDRPLLAKQAAASLQFFRNEFHFEAVSSDITEWILARLHERSAQPRGEVQLDWIARGNLMRRFAFE